MKPKQSFVDLAVEEAKKADFKYRLGCVIYSKKHLLSASHNQPFTTAKKLHPRFRYWPTSIHAEVATILNARTDLKGSTMIVVRISKDNELKMSKPCMYCMRYIEFVGIRKVWYSTSSYPYFELLNI